MRGNDIHGQIERILRDHKGEDLNTQQIATSAPNLTIKQIQSALSRMSRRNNAYGITRPRRGYYRMPLHRPSAVVAEYRSAPPACPGVGSFEALTAIRKLKNGDLLLEDKSGDLWRAIKIV